MAYSGPIFLCSPLRTAIGSFQGALSSLSATELGARVVKEIVSRTKLDTSAVQEVILGSVLMGGQGQAPARQVVIKAGLPNTVQAMTINKVCSSGLKAVMLAANTVELGHAECVIAGGMESMSQAPYFLPSLRSGARLGHTQAVDSILNDGLWDPYQNYHMGDAAELCAREKKISRDEQDKFAIESYTRSLQAIKEGRFNEEIIGVSIRKGKDEVIFNVDEEPGRGNIEKIPSLKPVFQKEGTVTAANASSINDGASAMIVCTEAFAKKHSLTPLARVVAQGWHAQAPEWFTTAPVGAVENVVAKAKCKVSDIDLFELNEAFSVVSLACQKGLDIPSEKLNINGGAVSLGHPIGASGARILTTLIYSLKRTQGRYGIASLCNGGGEATALLVERV